MSFTSEFSWGPNPDPQEIQDSFEKFDLRVGLAGNNRQWEVAVVGKNLSDEKTFRFYGELPGPAGRFANIDRGREVGIQAKFDF